MAKYMYSENVYFPDVFKGCEHECVYCKPSFQQQAKRQLRRCKVLNEKGIPKCYTFEPHAHLERLHKRSPKTTGKQFVFFPKGGDPAFATPKEFKCMMDYARANPQTTFLTQTKAPFILRFYSIPENVILAITLETNLTEYDTPSKYKKYSEISLAPPPFERAADFNAIYHNRKAVIIEPILKFNDWFKIWFPPLKPEFIYVGYDNHNCQLPEPTLSETAELIKELKKITEVRLKTIRQAWYEIPSQTPSQSL